MIVRELRELLKSIPKSSDNECVRVVVCTDHGDEGTLLVTGKVGTSIVRRPTIELTADIQDDCCAT